MPTASPRTWPAAARLLIRRVYGMGFVLLVTGAAVAGFRGQAHGFAYDLVELALAGLIFTVVVLLDRYAARKAAARTRPLPRWRYGAAGVGFLAAGIGAGLFGNWLNPPDSGWGNLVGGLIWLPCVFGVAGGVVFAGRAVCTGNTRRLFWRHPPAWLAPAVPAAAVRPPPRPDPSPGDL